MKTSLSQHTAITLWGMLQIIILLMVGFWALQGTASPILSATGIGELQNISLPRGFYQVVISYESTAGESGGAFVSSSSPDSILSDTVQFYSWRSESSAIFWVLKDLDDICYVQSLQSELSYTDITIFHTAGGRFCLAILLAFILVIADLILWLHRHLQTATQRRNMLCLLGIMVLIAWPIFTGKPIRGDDLIFHMNRIDAIAETLRDGFFPVRLYSCYFEGAGYAQPVFYGELFLYPAALLRLFGFPLVLCYQFLMLMTIILGTILAWIPFRKLFSNNLIALAATAASQLSLYRLSNLYQRDAVGEFLAMMFLPMVFCGFYLLLYGHSQNHTKVTPSTQEAADMQQRSIHRCQSILSSAALMLAIGMAGIISSHVLTTVLVIIILLIWSICNLVPIFRNSVWKSLLKSAVLALALSAYFWVPFVDYYLAGTYHFNDDLLAHSVSVVGYQISTAGLFALKFDPALDVALIGLPTMLCVIGFLICVAIAYHKVEVAADRGASVIEPCVSYRSAISLSMITLLCILVTWKAFPWDGLLHVFPLIGNFLNTLQFPFRFAALASIFAAMELGFSLELLYKDIVPSISNRKFLPALYGALLSALFIGTATASLIMLITSGDRVRLEDGYAYTNEFYGEGFYLPDGIYIRERFQDLSYEVSSGRLLVSNFEKGHLRCTFTCQNQTDQPQRITLPLISYKGYVADPKEITVSSTDLDLVAVNIPERFDGAITVQFCEPWYWHFSELFSLFTFLTICYTRLLTLRKT